MRVLVDPNLGDHRKTRRLAAALKLPIPHVIGHLVLLWANVMRMAETGELVGWSDEDIAEAAQYTGKAKAFVAALTSAGLLDRTGKLLVIHDWHKEQGNFLSKREKWREKKRGQRRDTQETGEGVPVVSPETPEGVPRVSLPSCTSSSSSSSSRTPSCTDTSSEAAPAIRSGSTPSLLASAYLRTNPGMISQLKASQIVEFYLARGAPPTAIEQACNDPKSKGVKIWELLEPIAPQRNGQQSVKAILDKWAAENPKKASGDYS